MCVHACLHTCTAGTISLFLCVCDSYHLSLTVSAFFVWLSSSSVFLLDTFVFSLFLKWFLFCFTNLSGYVEDYAHSDLSVLNCWKCVCMCVCACVQGACVRTCACEFC